MAELVLIAVALGPWGASKLWHTEARVEVAEATDAVVPEELRPAESSSQIVVP